MSEEVQLEDLNKGKQDNNVSLVSDSSQDNTVNAKVETQAEVKIKKPRKVLHFSDGTLEEYSTDEEDDTDANKESSVIPKNDPVKLQWGPWMWYWTLYTGSSALAACDYVGEGLANFLGITSPKYQYEIEEFQRMQEDEEKEKKEQEEQMAGWTIGDAGQADEDGRISAESNSQLTTTKQPSFKKHKGPPVLRGIELPEIGSSVGSPPSSPSSVHVSPSESPSGSPAHKNRLPKRLVPVLYDTNVKEMSTWV